MASQGTEYIWRCERGTVTCAFVVRDRVVIAAAPIILKDVLGKSEELVLSKLRRTGWEVQQIQREMLSDNA